MKKENNQYESIKQKLLKLQALAEQGYKGEAEVAKRAIERLCRQYGITLEEVLCVEEKKRYEFNIGRYKYMLTLFVQCHGVVTGTGTLSYYKRSRNTIAVDLTPLQYAELSSLFEWHKANFLKDLAAMQDTIVEAYVNKHNIFRTLSEEEQAERDARELELTPAQLRRLAAILAMQSELGDNRYHKQLEAPK